MKAVAYGVGAMGRWIVEMMVDKGVEVVGGIDAPGSPLIGQDLGTASGIAPLGVKISDNADEVLDSTKPDIAIICITTYLADMMPFVERCASRGINCITTAEEMFYPWRTEPELTKKIDALCKQNNCSAYGIGYQDYHWGNMITQLAGCCHEITAIKGFAQFNVDDYGPEVARDHGVGMTPEQYKASREKAGTGTEKPSYQQMVGDLIIDGCGLTFKSVSETISQTYADVDIECKSLGIKLPKGVGTGNTNKTHFETMEGVTVDIEMVSKVYAPGEEDQNNWDITGRPNCNVQNKKPATDVFTCTEIVSRIPDVIAAPAGYLKAFEMPPMKYKRYFK